MLAREEHPGRAVGVGAEVAVLSVKQENECRGGRGVVGKARTSVGAAAAAFDMTVVGV